MERQRDTVEGIRLLNNRPIRKFENVKKGQQGINSVHLNYY